MPISRQTLKNSASDIHVYFRGVDYAQRGHVRILDEEVSAAGSRILNALVRGTSGSSYQIFLEFAGSGDAILQASCTCPAFQKYKGYCKHIVAAVLTVEEENAVLDPFSPRAALRKPGRTLSTPSTDTAVLNLMEHYTRKSQAQALSHDPGQLVELSAQLEIGDFSPRLSFRLGNSRLYVLRDLEKFQQAMSEGSEVTYGKGLSFPHRISSFREECRPMLRFLQAQPRQQYPSYRGDLEYRRYLRLSPPAADEFFCLCRGGSIPCVLWDEPVLCEIREGKPELSVSLYRLRNGSLKLSLKGSAELIPGLDTLYVLRDGVLYCCPTEYRDACERFLLALRKNKWSLSLTEADLNAFYSCVLTEILPYIRLETKLDLAAYEPLPMVAAIYLDQPEPGIVTGRLRFRYGERQYDGFCPRDLLTPRDIRQEAVLEEALKRYFPQPDPKTGLLSIRGDEDALYRLVSNGITELSGMAELFITDTLKGVRVQPRSSVQVGVRVNTGLLELDFQMEGVDPAELMEVLRSYHQAKRYHRLRSGSFLNLEDNAIAEFSEMAEGLGLDSKDLQKGRAAVPEYRALYLDSLMKQSDCMRYDRDNAFRRLVRDMKEVSDADFEVPAVLKPILRHYQKTGYRWLRTIAAHGFGGILADDMGLGKTVQVLALLLSWKEEILSAPPPEEPETAREYSGLSLVACPSSLVLNWMDEIRKFAPTLRAVAVIGHAFRREELLREAGDADLIVTSYDLLKRDLELYQELRFDFVIIDEAQYIKNPSTQNAKAVKALQSRVRFALTGTPVENSLADLWSIYDYLMPGYLYSYHKFRRMLETPIVREGEAAASERLRRLVSPFILRRLKKDVLQELPDKVETVLYSEMTEEQRKLYLAMALAAQEQLTDGNPVWETPATDADTEIRRLREGLESSNNPPSAPPVKAQKAVAPGGDRMILLSMLLRLRQLCCDPALLYENYGGGSGKLELCLELVQSCIDSGHKLLLFSQFTSMLAIIGRELNQRDIRFQEITGNTPAAERLELVNTFNNDDTPVFLISLKAGGTGLNLTGADVVIHYDPWWNLSAQNQATDRVHRIGQRNSVQVYRLIAKESIEEKILLMQQSKAQLSEDIVQDGVGLLTSLSQEELLDLFR